MGEYYHESGDVSFVEGYYDNFIEPCVSFMAQYIDDTTGLPHASYDLWEQKFLTSTYTVCTVIAALEAGIVFANATKHGEHAEQWHKAVERMRAGLQALYHPDGYFRKGFLVQETGDLAYDDTLDISNLFGPFMFASLPFTDERLTSTYEHIKRELLNTSPIGGVIRYPGDNYFLAKSQYKGNPWIVCTLWLAQYMQASGAADEAYQLLRWAFDRKLPSGVLSEQFDPETGYAISVAPLVWSHAEFINTVVDLSKKQ